MSHFEVALYYVLMRVVVGVGVCCYSLSLVGVLALRVGCLSLVDGFVCGCRCVRCCCGSLALLFLLCLMVLFVVL